MLQPDPGPSRVLEEQKDTELPKILSIKRGEEREGFK